MMMMIKFGIVAQRPKEAHNLNHAAPGLCKSKAVAFHERQEEDHVDRSKCCGSLSLVLVSMQVLYWQMDCNPPSLRKKRKKIKQKRNFVTPEPARSEIEMCFRILILHGSFYHS